MSMAEAPFGELMFDDLSNSNSRRSHQSGLRYNLPGIAVRAGAPRAAAPSATRTGRLTRPPRATVHLRARGRRALWPPVPQRPRVGPVRRDHRRRRDARRRLRCARPCIFAPLVPTRAGGPLTLAPSVRRHERRELRAVGAHLESLCRGPRGGEPEAAPERRGDRGDDGDADGAAVAGGEVLPRREHYPELREDQEEDALPAADRDDVGRARGEVALRAGVLRRLRAVRVHLRREPERGDGVSLRQAGRLPGERGPVHSGYGAAPGRASARRARVEPRR